MQFVARRLLGRLVFMILAIPSLLSGQQQESSQASDAQLLSYVKAYLEIGDVRDAIHADLARPANKTEEAQSGLHERMNREVAEILERHDLTQETYSVITLLVSADLVHRERFDQILASLEDNADR